MADDDDTFPPEIQKSPSEFAFKELCHVTVISNKQQQPVYPTIRSNLLAVANIYSYLFVGCPNEVKVFSSSRILDTRSSSSDASNDFISTISLRNSPNWIAVSADNLTLAICCRGDRGPLILLFDIRNIVNKAKPTKTPFCSFVLSNDADALVTCLQWNPSTEWPHLLAVCLSSGSFHMLSVQETATEIGRKPADFGAACVCWSPKGKQLVIGKTDGTLHQVTPKLEIRRSISVTSVIDRPVRTCDILWLSTHQFAAAYIAKDSENENFNQPNLFLAQLPAKDEKKDVVWRNYEDPCYGMNEIHSPRYMMAFLDKWEMFVALSSNSTDSSVLAKNKETQIWEIWTLDDSARANLPISEFTGDDSAPIGIAVVMTATKRIVVDDTRECGPMPVLVILTNDGLLCPFHMINLMETYPALVNPVSQLDLSGERKLTAGKATSTGDEGNNNTKQSTTAPIKQRLMAKPSIHTSTPKPAAFESKIDSPFGTVSVSNPPFATSTPVRKLPLFDSPSVNQVKNASLGNQSPLVQENLQKAKSFGTPSKNSDQNIFVSVSQTSTVGISQLPEAAIAKTKLSSQKSIMPSTGPVVPGLSIHKSIDKLKTIPLDNPPSFPPSGQTTRMQKAGPAEVGTFAKKREAPTQPQDRSKNDITLKKLVSQPTQPSVDTRSITNDTFEEISAFDQELSDFLVVNRDLSTVVERLGDREEKAKIKKEIETNSNFSSEITKTTHELHKEIQDTSTVLVEHLSAADRVSSKKNLSDSHMYKAMLYNQPLDPINQKKMKVIRGIYDHIKTCLRDTNSALDIQWEEMYEKKRGRAGMQPKKTLQAGEWETAYQALVYNTKILHEQELRLMLLGQELDRLRLYNTTAMHGRSSRRGPVPDELEIPSKSIDLQLLADTMLLEKEPSRVESSSGKGDARNETLSAKGHEKTSASPANRNSSPKKQAQLGQLLTRRKVTPVRTSGVRDGTSFTIKPTLFRKGSATSAPFEESRSTSVTSSSVEISSKSTSEATTPSDEVVTEPEFPGVEPGRKTPSPAVSDVQELTFSHRTGDNVIVQKEPVRVTKRNDPVPDLPQHPNTTANIIPQGSATFGYGAPKTALSSVKPRILASLPATAFTEAESNLNNPPKVVNIQQLRARSPAETDLPVKFEARPEVPAGAVEVVQKVLNTVIAEKRQGAQQIPPGSEQGTFQARKSSFTTVASIPSTNIFQSKSSPSIFSAMTTTALSDAATISSHSQESSAAVFHNTQSSLPVFGSGISSWNPSSNQSVFGASSGSVFTTFSSLTPKVPVSIPTPSPQPALDINTKQGDAPGDVKAKLLQACVQSITPSPAVPTLNPVTLYGDSQPGATTVTIVPSLFGLLSSSSSSISSSSQAPSLFAKSPITSSIGGLAAVSSTISTESGASVSTVSVTSLSDTKASTTVPNGNLLVTPRSTSPVPFGSQSITPLAGETAFSALPTTTSSEGTGYSSNMFGSSTPSRSIALPATAPAFSFGSKTIGGTTANSLFGGSKGSSTNLFGSSQPADPSDDVVTSPKTTQSSSGVFGSSLSTSASGGNLFGSVISTGTNVFGSVTTTTSGGSSGLFGATGNAFGFGSSTSVFGAVSTGSNVFTTPATTASVIGQSSFGAQKSVFGAPTSTTAAVSGTSSAASGGLFGTTPFSNENVFGSKPSTFGQQTGFGKTSSESVEQTGFGAPTSDNVQKSAFGGGFFSGLGGAPSQDAANKNPFAIATSQSQQSGTGFGSSMFGNSGQQSFGTSSFGKSPTKSSVFAGGFTGASGVGSQGFGAFSKQPTAGFGSPAAFGSSPAFGSQTAFGSSPLGGSSTFGAQSSSGAFGQSASQTGGFASFADSSKGFGALAGQESPFGGFQQQPQQTNTFGSSGFGASTQSSFSGWR